jgi:hypothetical protein
MLGEGMKNSFCSQETAPNRPQSILEGKADNI